MILYIQTMDGKREQHRIATYEDFNKIYDLFPMTQQIVWGADSLKEAAEEVAEYLSSHNMESWVEDGELSKGLKEKILGAGLIAAGMTAPLVTSHIQPNPSTHIKAPVYPGPVTTPTTTDPMAQFDASRPYLPFGQHKADRFLWNIMQIESSGGKNQEHPEIQNGSFKGQKAMGRWGLLIPTVMDLAKQRINAGDAPREIASLVHRTPEQIRTIIEKRPHIELELARTLANRVLHNQAGDHQRAAYSWLNGTELKRHDIPDEKLQGHSYVEKYNSYDMVNPFKSAKKMHKSEESFGDRITKWMKLRQKQTNVHAPVYPQENDPGRLHEDKDIPKPADSIDKIRQAIKDAKNSIKD